MSLTRKMLRDMGIEGETAESIIAAHAETVDGLKADIERFRGDAEKLPEVQRELDELRSAQDGGYEEKYRQAVKEFGEYRQAQAERDERAARKAAYRELLRQCGIGEKRIEAVLRASDTDAVELEGGRIKNAARLADEIRTEWADFIVSTDTKGAVTSKPPVRSGTDYESMTDEEYYRTTMRKDI